MSRPLNKAQVSSPGARRGAVATELAILLPFIILMFVIAVDFCRVFYATQVVEGAAYCGALYASGTARPTAGTTAADAATQAAVADGTALNPPLQSGNVTVSVGTTSATVTVTYPFHMVTSYLGTQTVSISRTATVPLAPRAPGDTY
jgi:Flp pilus assembly protein TadG